MKRLTIMGAEMGYSSKTVLRCPKCGFEGSDSDTGLNSLAGLRLHFAVGGAWEILLDRGCPVCIQKLIEKHIPEMVPVKKGADNG